MQFPTSLTLFAILGMVSAADLCDFNEAAEGPYENNESSIMPTEVGHTTIFTWGGNDIYVKKQSTQDACPDGSEGDCNDTITFNFKNKGTTYVRARVKVNDRWYNGAYLKPGTDCDVTDDFTRKYKTQEVSFAS
ncbi:hypothetical protein CORC01_02256 [Colletotrichum orchidophilum]|uniref:Uncharacterized protein n=1 Tax=Colletotrichum orchidophilum TaxID=1209926 RepID=A0A1G4BM92_9PEZI|nr:uncharacterized protein CORC01_02256 [Colletotrichum orchidophilum]OHF02561.1 hypothetical protein CORC01_02256 [Colletotrichum orchidophilum]